MAQAMAAQCERDKAGASASSGSADGGAAVAAMVVGGEGGRWQLSLLDRYTAYNQGVWKNVLALGLQDARVMSVVQTVWNVTAESRKISARQRDREQRERK